MDGLTKADMQRAREALVLNDELEKQIERAKSCDIECSEADQRCKLAKIQLQKILGTYGGYFPSVHKSPDHLGQ